MNAPRLGESDLAVLRAVHPGIERELGEVFEDFRRRLGEIPATTELAPDGGGHGLEADVRAWFDGVLLAPRDAGYAARQEGIGRRLAETGLPPQSLFAAMGCLQDQLVHLIDARSGGDKLLAEARRSALIRALSIDLTLMSGAYHRARCPAAADGERLRELVAALAHEVRNQLGAISGVVQVLTGRLGEESKKINDLLQERVVVLERQVRDVLDYAHPPEPKVSDVRLLRLLRATVAALQEDTVLRGVEFELAGDDVVVRGDGDQLASALEKLLRCTALALAGKGCLRITVAPGDPCSITVVDDGPGIPAWLRREAVRPFLTARHRGDGFELILARKIIEDHGGQLDVDCPLSGGTRFTVTLPMGTTPPPPDAAPSASA